jgi:hypothetical protein
VILQRTNAFLRGLAPALALATLALAACADTDPANDPVEWFRSARRATTATIRDEPVPTRPSRAEPPPDEGRPYPNLAAVPQRPARVTARQRQAELRALSGEHDAAVQRDAALRGAAPPVGSSAPAVDGRYVGTVIPDAIGAFGPGDERLLRQAVEAARDNDGTIRVEGEAEASLAVVDRLTALGAPRARVELVPTQAVGASGRMVEIFVAYEPKTR